MNMLRFLSEISPDDDIGNGLFNVAIATIFAREMLEGAIIIGQYRTVIQKMDGWEDDMKTQALQIVNRSAAWASLVAVVVVLAIAIPLGVLSQDLNESVSLVKRLSCLFLALGTVSHLLPFLYYILDCRNH
jgi:ABC-type proline/glycine betaine transport system permease subunit